MEKTKTLNVLMNCIAYYQSSIEVPEEMTLEEAIEYARDHINEIRVCELTHIPLTDEVDEEFCSFDGE